MSRALFGVLAALGLVWAASGADDPIPQPLPDEAAARVKKYRADLDAIQQRAEKEARAKKQDLVRDLTELQSALRAKKKLAEAEAVAEELDVLQNLVTNGSFEDGPESSPDGYVTLATGSEAIKGWTVALGTVDHISTWWVSGHGKRSLDLNGTSAGGIAQTFPTEKGQKYKLTFLMAGNPGALSDLDDLKLEVEVAATRKTFSFDASATTAQAMGWKTVELEFTAGAARTTLTFRSLHGENDLSGPALDRVRVVPVN